jgi:hypothetical protein
LATRAKKNGNTVVLSFGALTGSERNNHWLLLNPKQETEGQQRAMDLTRETREEEKNQDSAQDPPEPAGNEITEQGLDGTKTNQQKKKETNLLERLCRPNNGLAAGN